VRPWCEASAREELGKRGTYNVKRESDTGRELPLPFFFVGAHRKRKQERFFQNKVYNTWEREWILEWSELVKRYKKIKRCDW
jgi:hypothetical protein